MEQDWLLRTRSLIGEEALRRLQNARVAVIGLGGVGAAAAEALCRAGVGSLILVDHDTVEITNLNRQLFAALSTLSEPKCQAAKERLESIAPDCRLVLFDRFYSPEDRDFLFDEKPDFILDAIDTVSCKLDLIEQANLAGVPIISCMGTGNRLDPTQFRIGDISETAGCGCGLAKVMRRELKKRSVAALPVVYSTETPQAALAADTGHGRHSPASISFCPPVAGYCMAAYAVRKLTEKV